MKLSIVSTMYYSASYLPEFYSRVCAAAEKLTDDFEIVLVNDGSPDNALEVAISLYNEDPRVRIIDLSRNFGHHKAMMTGIEHARGDLVFLIDCDLEEAPELLGPFQEELQASGCDVVYGVQKARKGSILERLSGEIFYAVSNALSDVDMPRNLVTVRLMTARYTAALVKHKEYEVMLAGLWVITGFDQRSIGVEKGKKGSSTYTFARKVGHLVNAITSFSVKPLVWVFGLGMTIMLLSLGAAVILIARHFIFGAMLAGWASLMVMGCFFGGLNIWCIGIIGIYLSKVFLEVKRRPYTVIRTTYEHE